MASPDHHAVLDSSIWLEQAKTHSIRARLVTDPARWRKDRGQIHPIEDFLFQYYPFPLALLESWHPGTGYALEWADSAELPDGIHFSSNHYSREDGRIFLNRDALSEKHRIRMIWIRDLLLGTASRPPNFSCHGLHEWAMVYGGDSIRHEKTTPLRLPQARIDELVNSRPIVCSHHDAFRFFADSARPLNRLRPSLATRSGMEQPGCVHANMDLYKWAAKLMPWTGSDLLLDTFELALKLRDLDMRASPYDLSAWGRDPIKIETSQGRTIYETEQKRLAAAAIPLRFD